MTQPPPGYLGAEGRLGSGPSNRLVETGYSLEIADAPFLHRGLTLADLAHVLELESIGLIPRQAATRLCRELLTILDTDAEAFPYDPLYGDAYNSRERYLEAALGDTAGWLPTGRTRREAGRIAFRIATRERLLTLHSAGVELIDALVGRARALEDAYWSDTTYLQPAQPSSFGHYLAGSGEALLRDLARVESAFRNVNVSPAGAGGVAGTSIPLDRRRLAASLGFDRPAPHIRDGMWSADVAAEVVGSAAQMVITAERLTEDLEIFSSPQFGYVSLASQHSRASVLLPQKKNPYALAVVRAGAGTLIGRAAGVLVTQRTPTARTDNWLHAYGESVRSLELAIGLIGLSAEVVALMSVDKAKLAASATSSYATSADLAERLVLDSGVDYRTSYKVVAIGTATAESKGRGEVTVDDLTEAAMSLEVDLTRDAIERAIAYVSDLSTVVNSRDVLGGSAPARVAEHCDSIGERLERMTATMRASALAIDAAERDLVEKARSIAS